MSALFLDTVSARFGDVLPAVLRDELALAAADRAPTWAGWSAVRELGRHHGIRDLNLVKPGVGETTCVLLPRAVAGADRPGRRSRRRARSAAGRRARRAGRRGTRPAVPLGGVDQGARRVTLRESALDLGLPPALARDMAANAPPVPVQGRPIVATDLDRTLIYSVAALGLGETAAPRLSVAEMHDGRPASFYTRTADRLIEALDRAVPLVPVTTRTLEQFGRVRPTDRRPPYAVVANGIIVADGPAR